MQGDIVRVYDSNGKTLIWYYYDEYGVPSCELYLDGITALEANHLMYRGYYYDFETYGADKFNGGLGLYYLGSRYYDANIGRFISPDDISYLGANGDLNAYNLYAYCNNNPAMQRQMNNLNTAFNSSNNATKSINESNGVFANPWSFSAGLLTDTKYDMPSWLSVSALYAKGTLGWGYSVGDGYSLVSLSAGILDATFHTPKWFDSLPNNHIANPNIYLGVGTWNAYTSIGAGFSGSLEIVSCTIGIRFGDAVNIDVKGYVGAGFAFDLTNGFKFGGGVPFGYEISFNIDWYKLFN